MAGKIGKESVKIAVKTFWIINGQLYDCSAAVESKFTFEWSIWQPEPPIWPIW
jgi:hypothetical protein